MKNIQRVLGDGDLRTLVGRVGGMRRRVAFAVSIALVSLWATEARAQSYTFERMWPEKTWSYGPSGVAFDSSGNVYVADYTYSRIQVYTADGTFVREWGQEGSELGYFSSPRGVAVDASGNVYVADFGNHRIQKFSADGTYLAAWGREGNSAGRFNHPSGIAVDGLGNVYVADRDNNRIQKFTQAGAYVTQWGVTGAAAGQFKSPSGLGLDSAGNVYVADYGNNRVQKFTPDGAFVLAWGSKGSGDGQFQSPIAIAVDVSGDVFVLGYDDGRVQRFAPDGTFVGGWVSIAEGDGVYPGPFGVAVDSSGTVYVAESSVKKFTSSGTLLDVWRHIGSGPGQFWGLEELAVDAAGTVYVADSINNRVQKFTANGDFVTTWGNRGSGVGQFKNPAGLAVDGSGDVYVADSGNYRIQRFTADGVFVSTWGSFGATAGLFNWPYGVAVDGLGNVFVSESYNQRIDRFSRDGAFATAWSVGYYGPDTYGVAADGLGNVYVTAYSGYGVTEYSSGGTRLTSWGSQGRGNGQFGSVQGVAVDGAGYVYVVDRGNYRIQKFAPDGTFVTAWGERGSGPGRFHYPQGVAVDAVGNVYVSDHGRIEKFAPGPTPTVVMTSTAQRSTNVSPIPVKVAFSKPVLDFTAASITPGNATVTDFAGSGADYSFNLVPSGQGEVMADIAAGVVRDAEGNGNAAATRFTREFDSVVPVPNVTLQSSIVSDYWSVYVLISFGEPVTGFDSDDISVTNGYVGHLGYAEKGYTASLIRSAAGAMNLTIPSGACLDAAGNANAALLISDISEPFPTITGPWPRFTATGPVDYLVKYGDTNTVTLNAADVTLNKFGTANATVAVSQAGSTWRTVTLSNVSGHGALSIHIAARTATSILGLPAAASETSKKVEVDDTAIAVNIGSPSEQSVRSASVYYLVTYNNVSKISLGYADVTLNKTGTANADVVLLRKKTEIDYIFTVSVVRMTGTGTLGISIAPDTARDNLDLPAPAAGPSATFIVDNTAPEITLLGENPVQIMQGTAYVDAGANASDNVDGDITSRVVVDTSAVDIGTVGSYTVTYNVADALGNAAAQVTRTVTVVAQTQPPVTPHAPTGALAALLALLFGHGGGGGGGGPCFIATAAYGTPMAQQIDTLRDFRDAYLLTNAVGGAFVDLYYHLSPAIADVVANNPVLASTVRVALIPVVLAARLALALPYVTFALCVLSTLTAYLLHKRKDQYRVSLNSADLAED